LFLLTATKHLILLTILGYLIGFQTSAGEELTTQAQRPGARDATIATVTRPPGSLQRLVGARLKFTQRTIEVVLPQKPEKFSHRNVIVPGTIGGLIVTARKNRGLTQKQLAAKASIRRQWLGRWERNRSIPDQAQWTKLATIIALPLAIPEERH